LNKFHKAGKKYMDFWDYYNHTGLKMMTLYQKSGEVEKLDDQIQDIWKRHVDVNSSFAKLLSGPYSLYLSLIRNCPYSSQKLFDKYYYTLDRDNIGEEITNLNLYNERNITMHISMSKERLGRITYVSPNVAETLGFQQQNLVGRNLNVLVPGFMQETHNKLLVDHLNRVSDIKKTSRLYTNIDVALLSKAGNIVPSKLYLSVHPYIQKELVYVAMIKRKDTSSSKDTIIVGEDGWIQGYTHNASLQLALSPLKKTHIGEICKGYMMNLVGDIEDQMLQMKVGSIISETKNNFPHFLERIMDKKLTRHEREQIIGNINL